MNNSNIKTKNEINVNIIIEEAHTLEFPSKSKDKKLKNNSLLNQEKVQNEKDPWLDQQTFVKKSSKTNNFDQN